MTEGIRWKQRFNNYLNALQTLTEAVALAQQRPLTKLEQQGLIQGFEFTHELAWNVLKDYLVDVFGGFAAQADLHKRQVPGCRSWY